MVRDGVLSEEGLALAVSEAEEEHVGLVEVIAAGEPQLTLANEALVYIADQIACIALAIGKDYLRLGVVDDEQTLPPAPPCEGGEKLPCYQI